MNKVTSTIQKVKDWKCMIEFNYNSIAEANFMLVPSHVISAKKKGM